MTLYLDFSHDVFFSIRCDHQAPGQDICCPIRERAGIHEKSRESNILEFKAAGWFISDGARDFCPYHVGKIDGGQWALTDRPELRPHYLMTNRGGYVIPANVEAANR